ncbi:MAG TPA: family 20 glycosylhydrolase [Rudaea sp.]
MPNASRLARKVLCALALTLAMAGCRSPNPVVAATAPTIATDSAPISLIPAPYSLQRDPGFFEVRDGTVLRVQTSTPEMGAVAEWLRDTVLRTRGLHLRIEQLDAKNVGLKLSDGPGIDLYHNKPDEDADYDEHYALSVSDKGIVVDAFTPHGFFNAATTLWQLLTLDGKTSGAVRVPCLRIEDQPRFAWRGLMLDSARHFQPPEYVKQFIDWMALHKYNVLHWHLTDDQGWRIEIKKYPKLTEVGAWRTPADNPRYPDGKPVRVGGYYTQEQIRDIVAYAQQRYVTIVPEIEMPGHAQAAIAAYPQLGVTGRNPGVSHDWGVHTYLYNVEDSTFIFLQNVLTETMALFPSKYIHVGGDEAAKDQWQASKRVQQRMRALGVNNEAQMQSWLIKRTETFLAKHGRKLIGWDEILEGGLPPQATVMSWRGTKGAIDAARQGHDVVLSPDPDLYINHLATDLAEEPAGRPGAVTLRAVYDFDPLPKELDAARIKHVLGAQANLWSEYLATPADVTHAAWPRAAALAEVLWSPASAHDWHGFLDRLAVQLERYRLLGLDYGQTPFAVDVRRNYDAKKKSVAIDLSNQVAFGEIRYTLDGSVPTAQSTLYHSSFDTQAHGEIRATAFVRGITLADARASKLDPGALLRRSSAELASCHPGKGLSLKLPGIATAHAPVKAYLVDIFDPCWSWQQADLDGIARIEVDAASLPYNFQLWHDSTQVVDHPPEKFPAGELQVHLDGCNGELLAAAPITPLLAQPQGAKIELEFARRSGKHDLCLRFATGMHDPLHVIDTVSLIPRP